MQGDIQIFFRSKDGLRIDVEHKLCRRQIIGLKKAYILVQDLDSPKLDYILEVKIIEPSVLVHFTSAPTPSQSVNTNTQGGLQRQK